MLNILKITFHSIGYHGENNIVRIESEFGVPYCIIGC